MGAIPASWLIYVAAQSSDPNAPPLFTRLIDKYTEAQDRWAARNDLHVQMLEQAGADRALFNGTKPHDYVNMKFPEYVLSPPGIPRIWTR